MSNEQKLREALQAISHIDDTTNHSVDASAALDRIGQIARQALALPTAEQVDDINVAESLTSVTKTAAPVGEREAFEHDLSKSPFEFDMDRWPDNAPVDWPGSYKQYHVQCAWDAWQARAALSAGDAVDAQRYRLLRTKIYIDPKELILRIRDVFLTSGATLPEMLDAAIDAAMRKGQL